MKQTGRILLTQLGPGQSGTVTTLNSGPGFINRMAAMGLCPGARVTMMQNFKKRQLIIMARNTFIALGSLEAEQILMETPAMELEAQSCE